MATKKTTDKKRYMLIYDDIEIIASNIKRDEIAKIAIDCGERIDQLEIYERIGPVKIKSAEVEL